MRKNGFTLLELILYISIAGVTIGVMVFGLNQIYKINTANNVSSTVNTEANKISDLIKSNVESADTIVLPDNSNLTGDSLTLYFNDQSTKTFNINGDNFQIINSPSNLVQTINIETIIVSDLTFNLINNDNSNYKEGIKFSFTVTYRQSNLAPDSFEYDSELNVTDTVYLNKFTDINQESLYLMEASIKSNPNLSIWLDANDSNLIKDVDNKVSTWTDKSNNNRLVNQPTLANQPVFTNNILNSYPVIRFDGTDDFLSFDGGFLLNTKYDIYIVGARNSDKSNNFWLAGDSINQNENLNIGYFDDTTLRFSQLNNNLDETVDPFANPEFRLFNFSNNLVGKNIEQNGLSIAGNTNTTDLISFNNASIGNVLNTDYLDGDIAEILIFNANLTEYDKSIVLDYLNTKYNIYISNDTNLYMDDSN